MLCSRIAGTKRPFSTATANRSAIGRSIRSRSSSQLFKSDGRISSAEKLQPRPRLVARAAMASASSKPLVYFVTGNQNKLKEVVAILKEASKEKTESPLPCEVRALDVDLPELQGLPQEIAAAKAEAAAKVVAARQGQEGVTASAVIVEDTSLCFDALKGLPGPYVKDFLKAVGPEGLPKLLVGFDDDGAYAQCVFAFAEVDKSPPSASSTSSSSSSSARVFVGQTRGTIARSPRGPRTFGWDCVFVPSGDENNNPGRLTYAEMSSEAKNAISHRRRALDKLRAFLAEEYNSKGAV